MSLPGSPNKTNEISGPRLTAGPAGSAPAQWGIVERAAASSYFRRSPKLRSFLLYIAENSLLGRREDIREQFIGHRVFGRPPDYNVTEDNIVRVEARELRKRLSAYFSTEGKDEPLSIEVPKGGYMVRFVPRGVEAEAPPEEPEPGEPPEPEPAAPADEFEPPVAGAPRHPPRWAAAAAITLLIAAVAVLAWQNHGLRDDLRRVQAMDAADRDRYAALLGPIGTPQRGEALLVLSNPRALVYFGSDRDDPPLARLDKHEPAILVPPAFRGLLREALTPGRQGYANYFLKFTGRTYTGMGQAVSAFHLGRLLQSLDRRVRLTQARFLTWDLVQKQDVILTGSPHLHPWTSESLPEMNFLFTSGGFRNVKPLAGESPVYMSSEDTDYGVISMLTWPTGSRLFLLAGYQSSGSAAAGEFFANPEKIRPLYEKIKAAGGKGPASWEALLKIRIKDSIPVSASVEALRVRSAGSGQ